MLAPQRSPSFDAPSAAIHHETAPKTMPAKVLHLECAGATPPTHQVIHIGLQSSWWQDIRRGLERYHCNVHKSADSLEACDAGTLVLADLVVVGPGAGEAEPHEVCGRIRRQGYRGQILLITDTADAVARIFGLENGADVWIPSDLDARSALAQIRAMLRRRRALPQAPLAEDAGSALCIGAFVLNARTREANIGREPVALTTHEFDLLWILAKNAGEIMPRERLSRLLGLSSATATGGGRAIDTAIGRLRRKLGHPHGDRIRTIRATGYLFCAVSPLAWELSAPPRTAGAIG